MPAPSAPEASDLGVGASQGTLTLTIPIDVPVGTGGFEPSLALRYTSLPTDGPFGVGWGLGFGEIRRSTRFSMPTYIYAQDQYELDGELLIHAGASRYHTLTESFARIERNGNSWVVTLPNGTIARYGTGTASRIVEPVSGQTLRWLLAELEDANGNQVKFFYDLATDEGTAYPSEVRYSYRDNNPVGASRRVTFLYEDRPDPILIFDGGVKTVLTKRVREIRSTVGGAVFRRRILSYDEGSYATGRSRLTSTQLFGTDCGTELDPTSQCEGLPPTTYGYLDPADEIGTSGTSTHWEVDPNWHIPLEFEEPGGVDLGVRAADVDGDGLPDLVKSYESDSGPVLAVHLNTGSGWTAQPDAAWTAALSTVTLNNKQIRTHRVGDVLCDVMLEQDVASPMYFATHRNWSETVGPNQYIPPVNAQIADLNGDGRADIFTAFTAGSAKLGCGNGTAPGWKVGEVWLNTGAGWARHAGLSDSLPPLHALFASADGFLAQISGPSVCLTAACESRLALVDAGVRLANLDRNGRLDLVAASWNIAGEPMDPVTGVVFGAWFNTDTGWNPSSLHALPAATLYWDGFSGYYDPGTRLVDLNGDGLDDLVKRSNLSGQVGLAGQQVWINTGYGWCTDSACNAPELASPIVLSAPFVDARIGFADLNGDGLPDLFEAGSSRRAWLMDPGGPGGTAGLWREDGRFAPPQGMETAIWVHGSAPKGGVFVLDVDGNGTADFVRSRGTSQEVRLSRTRFADLVRAIDNGRGGSWAYEYSSAVAQRASALEQLAESDATAFGEPVGASESVLWTTTPVLGSVTADGGPNAGPYSTTYRYAHPRFCHAVRSWLGFRAIEMVRPDGALERRFYWQRHGRAGAESRAEVWGGGSRLWLATSEVEVVDGSQVGQSTAGAKVGRLVRAEDYARYGTQRGARRVVELEYNDVYGFSFVKNVTIERPSGKVEVTRTPKPADLGSWIAGLVQTENVQADGTTLVQASHVYDVAGRRILTYQLAAPRGGSGVILEESWTYDLYGNLRSHTDPASRTEHYCYDGDQDLGAQGCPSVGSATHGLLVGVLDRAGEVSSFAPDLATGLFRSATRFNGDVVRAAVDRFGRAVAVYVQPAAHGTETLLQTLAYADGTANPAGQPHQERFDVVGDGSVLRSATYFDGLGRAVRTVADSPAGYVGSAVIRDHAGRPLRATEPLACAGAHCTGLTGLESPATTQAYDLLGRPVLVTAPDGGISALRYASATRTQPVGLGSLGSDSTFDAVLAKDANGNLVERIVDGERVVFVDECQGTVSPGTTDLSTASCGSADTTFYTYEGSGELAAIYDAQAVATSAWSSARHRFVFLYDTLGRQIEIQDPDTQGPGAGPRTMTYDVAGNLESVLNARGQQTVFQYDDLDRPTHIDRPPGELDVTITYDPHTRQRASVTEAGGYSESLDYDDFGRLARRTLRPDGTIGFLTDWEYNLLGQVTRIRYPVTNYEVVYEYAAGQVAEVCDGPSDFADCDDATAFGVVEGVTYDDRGRVETVQQGSGLLAYGYDQASRISSLVFTANGGAREVELAYGRDPAGNVTAVVDAHTTDTLDASASYGYDTRHRLVSRTLAGSTTYFSYDRLGNLTGRDVAFLEAVNQFYDHSAKPHALTRVEGPGGQVLVDLEYDADGNVTRRGTQHYSFDSANRLVCVGTAGSPCAVAEYRYDVDGRRIYESVDGGRVLVGDLFEWKVSGDRRADAHVMGLGRRLATRSSTKSKSALRAEAVALPGGLRIDPDLLGGAVLAGLLAMAGAGLLRLGVAHAVRQRPWATLGTGALVATLVVPPQAAWGGVPSGGAVFRRMYVSDPLGTAVLVTSQTGARIARRIFEPFGLVVAEESTEATAQVFAGHQAEPEVGLYDAKARWYDPALGRFLSVDPLIRNPSAPQSMNGYSYTENNPVNLVDPTGEVGFVPFDAGAINLAIFIQNAVQLELQGLGSAPPPPPPPSGSPVGSWSARLSQSLTALGNGPRGSSPVVDIAGDWPDHAALRVPTEGVAAAGVAPALPALEPLLVGLGRAVAGLLAILGIGVFAQSGEVGDRSIDNPSSLEGATPEEVEEAAREAGFTERGDPPRNDPNGARLRKPGNPADQVRIQSGNPADPNPVKQGPYVRISQGGRLSDPIPLAGNPTLR